MRGYRRMALLGLVVGFSFIFVFGVNRDGWASESELLGYINQERAAHGLAPLSYSADLSNGAQLQANDMAACQCLSHEGYYASAENVTIAPTAWDAYQNWVGSPPHHQNMLGPYTQIGIGHGVDQYGNTYWTLNLA